METLEADAAHLAEEHAALRVELAGLEERHRAERASMARVEAQLAEVTRRREELARETERLGIERARLLADNIELDRKSAELAGQTLAAEAEVNRLAFEETQLREILAETEEKLKALRSEVEIAHQKRSEIEVELVRKQADLKYLDETSHKELNAPVAELAAGEEALPDGEALAEAERQYDEIQARIEALGPINPQALEEFQESPAAPRIPERAAAGPDRFHPRHREGHSGNRRSFPPEIRRSFRSHQRQFPRSLPDAVRRRLGRDAAHRRNEHRRIRHRHRRLAPRQETAKRAAALGRRKSADRRGPADGHLPLPAQPVLHPRRGGRPARRSQHRPPHAPAAGNVRAAPSSSSSPTPSAPWNPPKRCTA